MCNEQKPVLIFDHLYYSLCLISTGATKTTQMYVNILKEEMLREYGFSGLRPNKRRQALPVDTQRGCRVSL